MDRRIPAYGAAAIALIAIIAGILHECGKRPAVPEPLAPQPPIVSTTPKTGGEPRPLSTSRKSGLIAPRAINLDELQADIRKYYPEAEHAAGKEGHVMMALVVGADGSVTDVRVETSGGPAFDEAAKKVVLAMRFSPATKAGRPVAVEISEGIDFQFDGAR